MNLDDFKVLVVDDVAENRDLLKRRLGRLGLKHIDEAGDGVEALAAMDGKEYDLVLLDIMMPELDGFGVLDALKRNEKIDVPVIVVSALNEMDSVVRCIELGAADFMLKPFNPTLLRARVLSTLEKKALHDQTRLELRRKKMELNEARTLQLALAPPPFSGTSRGRALDIEVALVPAREVGGDLVDYFFVGEDLLVFCLGDVSDKGAGAAFMMARTHSLVRSLAGRPDAGELFRSPEKAIDLVNATLAEGNGACMFVTFVLVVLDLITGELAYIRAGHIPPFHRGAGDKMARLDLLSGPPLGLVEGMSYRCDRTALEPGDRVLILSDGITEAANREGVFFGEGPVGLFLSGLNAPAQGQLEKLLDEVRRHEEGLPAFDDVSAILVSFGAGVSP